MIQWMFTVVKMLKWLVSMYHPLPYSNFLEGLYGNKGCEDFEDKLRPLQTDEVEQDC